LSEAISREKANIEIVKTLIRHGSNVNENYYYESDGFTQVPLMQALDRGHVNIAEFLIKNGANLNFESKGITPLSYAIKLGNKQIINYFLEQNIKPKAVDYFSSARLCFSVEVFDGHLQFYSFSEKTGQLLTKAIEIDPKYGDAYGYRGVYYIARFNSENKPELIANGLSDLNTAIHYGCSNPLFFLTRADANFEYGNIDAAIDDYTFYLKVYPKSFAAYNNRGLMYSRKRNFQAAIKDFTKAIELDKYPVAGYKNRASCYLDMKREDKAILDWEEGIRIDPNDRAFVKNIGVYYYNQIANKGPNYSPRKAKEYLKRSGWEYGDDAAKELYINLVKVYGE